MRKRAKGRRRDGGKGHRYHHGDLRRAFVEEAVRVIQAKGIDALTLRAVGLRLGVSRSALYRHFADKSALLAAVASQGFRMLRLQTLEAWEAGRNSESFQAMGMAYVNFAMEHPSHYRVMFGGSVSESMADPELAAEASGAFQALVDAIVSLQKSGEIGADEPLQLARFIWSLVHGIAMLTIDGRLARQNADTDELVRFALRRLLTGISRAGADGHHQSGGRQRAGGLTGGR